MCTGDIRIYIRRIYRSNRFYRSNRIYARQVRYTQVLCVFVRNKLISTVSSPKSVYLRSFRLFYSFRRDTLSYQPTPEQPVLAQLQQVFAFLSQTQVNLHMLR